MNYESPSVSTLGLSLGATPEVRKRLEKRSFSRLGVGRPLGNIYGYESVSLVVTSTTAVAVAGVLLLWAAVAGVVAWVLSPVES